MRGVTGSAEPDSAVRWKLKSRPTAAIPGSSGTVVVLLGVADKLGQPRYVYKIPINTLY
jgi:hypothetical protein